MLTRVEFREGDLLRACDLELALAEEERRRALHARAGHRTRGVALGFEVSVQLGGRIALVGPGFGYDRCAGEVFSGRTAVVTAPTRDGVYDLAISPGRCADWLWLEPGEVGDELVVARVEVSSGMLGEPDVTQRRAVRGERGRIGTGTQQVAALQTNDVNTAAAGFQWTPYYFVSVAGLGGAPLPWLPALELRNPTRRRFELKVGYAGGAARIDLEWLGIEMPEAIPD